MVAQSRDLIGELMSTMTVVSLKPTDPSVERLVQEYRDRFGMGPRDMTTERATSWRGVLYHDKVLAVFGEHIDGKTLEVTDGYHDESPEGLIAYSKVAYGYLKLLETGGIDKLIHTCLYANTEQWKAVIAATNDPPYALVFVHTRKEQS